MPFFTVDTSTVDDQRSETIIIYGSYMYSLHRSSFTIDQPSAVH